MGSHKQDILALIATLRDRPDPSVRLGGGVFKGGRDRVGEWEHETSQLEKFVIEYKGSYDFSSGSHGSPQDPSRRPTTQDNVYLQLLVAILEFRFLEGRWQQLTDTNHRLVVLQSMRLLMRDSFFQRRFLLMGGRDDLVHLFEVEGSKHYDDFSRQGAAGGQYPLVHIASMLTKLEAEVLMHCCKAACYLLSTSDPYLLQCVLILVHKVAREDTLLSHHCQGILSFPAGEGAIETCEQLLDILLNQPKLEFRQLAAEVLIGVSAVDTNRACIISFEGAKVLFGLLQMCEDTLLVDVLTLLEILAMDPEASRQVRTIGGIDIILNLLNSRLHPGADAHSSLMNSPLARRGSDSEDRHTVAVLTAGCSLLTQLSFDDDNSLHIRNLNGVYVLASMLLYEPIIPSAPEEAESMQTNALRTLRFLYSLERNRKSFKRLFPPSIFERFIELGQYERDIAKYTSLSAAISNLPPDKRAVIQKSVNEMVDHDADRRVGRYLILGDPIGKGGWGTIYRTRKEGGQTHYALKEIPFEEGESDDAETHKEVAMLKQAEHPNIVRYVDSFTAPSMGAARGMSLYIVMELVEGSSLMELITSHIEKNQSIPEKRVRQLLVQICHALYYIHKKKQMTHRDIKPQNILINTELDVLTGETVLRPILVDFGLAQQRKSDHSVMTSFVGTLQYSCPELVNRRPYTDKADIWSLGVIIYQLVCLRNPFQDTNELQTARRIVEGDFAPIEDKEGQYTGVLKDLIAKMMTPDPDSRPDVCQVMSCFSSWDREDGVTERDNVQRMDELYLRCQMLERRYKNLQAEKERDKERLESAMRMRRETMTRAATAQFMPFTPSQSSSMMMPRGGHTPNTPGSKMGFGPRTPGTAYHSRYLAQTPGGRASRSSRAPSIRVPAMSVKEIDPATQMLNQLHRIIFVTQLPPQLDESKDLSKMRRAIEKYKRALFSRGTSGEGLNLKKEMSKLLSNSEEVIDVDFSGTELARADIAGASPEMPGRFVGSRWSLTYEDISKMLDELLTHYGYYDTGDAGGDAAGAQGDA